MCYGVAISTVYMFAVARRQAEQLAQQLRAEKNQSQAEIQILEAEVQRLQAEVMAKERALSW